MRPLRVALLLGSTRDGPPRPLLGRRVGKYVEEAIARKGHAVDVVDPAVVDLPLTPFQPHFTYRDPPAPLQALAETFAACDALVACTPEYNHAPSPALLHVLNHFGSSLFSFKPSLIVSYSAGQWGGAGEAFDEDGAPREDADRWAQYADRGVAQLEWWATAAREHRSKVDPTTGSPAFTASPSQRNAP
ncbi:NADPH-dependent FMN reductase [Aureococcus anophagefferens]|nr:NADPH-dependent FMN reductase [Aureococcus anophagefferens]